MYTVLVFSVVLLLGNGIREISAQTAVTCDPNLATEANFNLPDYLGDWYLVESYPNRRQVGGCNKVTMTPGTSSSSFNFVNSRVNNQTLSTIPGSAISEDTNPENSGKFRATIRATTVDYFVLATDYNDYAWLYSCQSSGTTRTVNSWKLSRTPYLSAAAALAIDAKIQEPAYIAAGLQQSSYEVVDHSSEACFHHITPEPGVPVVLPGQCDQNIPVVSNFNITRYTGLWRLIESYPSTHQDGGCNTATYTEVGGSIIEIVNTRVAGQTLFSTALVGFVQANGKLAVSFPSGSVSTSMWILDTDYETYALAYTCENVDANSRRVFSWKLSRTNELPTGAVTAINNIMSTIDVLDERYFTAVDRTDAACFYYPEPDSAVPLVFPGQCDLTITTEQDFNLTAYSGTWNLIESYPSNFQNGGCNDATYTEISSTQIQVVNRRVDNNTLHTITGTASVQGSGKLSVTFPTASGKEQTGPADLWVLATDYYNYALLYSCRNINDDYQSVSSWKMSRTNELPTEAVTPINNIMSTIDVLDERYFTAVDRTDAACFYYPEPDSAVPLVFPGQCDLTITTEQDFNLTAYLGTWNLIESYPSNFQNGGCNDATYREISSTQIQVVNRRVDNNTLHTITGTASVQGSGKLSVIFPTTNAGPADLWVLATDYSNYALLYSCRNINDNYKTVSSWKLSRSGELTPESQTQINNKMIEVRELDQRYFNLVDRTADACFYLPEPQEGESVVINGQCAENIPTVQNFNITAYAGSWRIIESYPSEFLSDSNCVRATYFVTPNNNINIRYSGVVDDTLIFNDGVAFIEASGKWRVTSSSIATPIDYWILATDYESYSLSYSCENMNAEQKRVRSWKLSRSNVLTSTAQEQIKSVIDNTLVLDERFYTPIRQADEDCFYYPDIVPGSTVQFYGQCNTNIIGQSNFNVSQFAGTWYQIEAYPTSRSSNCSGFQFTEDEEKVVVFSNTGNELNVVEGTANSTAAKLSFELPLDPENGNSITTVDLHILATDYTEYALAYFCSNFDAEYKTVVALKLSRNRNLTSEAITSINTAMLPHRDLDQRYFYEMDHSDTCEYPSSSFLIRSSIIVTIACLFLQRLF